MMSAALTRIPASRSSMIEYCFYSVFVCLCSSIFVIIELMLQFSVVLDVCGTAAISSTSGGIFSGHFLTF